MPKAAVLKKDPALLESSKFASEPQWLTDLRQRAWSKIDDLEMPIFAKINYHSWPLLNLTADPGINMSIPQTVVNESAAYQFASVGQIVAKAKLSEKLIKQGVILCDLATAIKEHGDLVKQFLFSKAIHFDEDRLTAANAALVNGGAFLYVPDDVEIDEPINLLQFQDSRQTTNFVNHTLIVAGENSRFKVLQRLATVGETENPAHVMVEIVAAAGSYVKFSALDSLAAQTHSYINRRGYLDRDARIDWTVGLFNDGNTVADFDSDLVGVGSHTEMQTVAISTDRQTQGIDTQVTNYGAHSEGNILQRGILLGASALVFNGIGKIIKGAHGSKAQQENRVLMLSPKARGDADPILLIDENDVIAGHAASVGRINQDQLYYLMSRGLTKEVAQRLVARGFLGVVLSDIPMAEVREQMIAMIERKLVNGQRTE
ncbi:Fe-S cluster assembly protein SufD [Lentilactobacillus fungorum]|uniref:Fe-S cluster assembly protein SufD n=1 Tax=Lentilactobacillus fungorum TaxID=2201250 RepID=A0ABQ3W0K7_9LACO|nr:Fe-S cluster assembly protein SufD [Lentilactobacillus fungorum]GHP13811.1 Fe-S cluster assembly protein SufD [Lentilactobacillus fungorum]